VDHADLNACHCAESAHVDPTPRAQAAYRCQREQTSDHRSKLTRTANRTLVVLSVVTSWRGVRNRRRPGSAAIRVGLSHATSRATCSQSLQIILCHESRSSIRGASPRRRQFPHRPAGPPKSVQRRVPQGCVVIGCRACGLRVGRNTCRDHSHHRSRKITPSSARRHQRNSQLTTPGLQPNHRNFNAHRPRQP